MKTLKALKSRFKKNVVNGQSGQGATEYILLLVVIVGLVVAFGPKIKKAFDSKVAGVTDKMEGFTGE